MFLTIECSVIVTAYNRREFLVDALKSVIKQTCARSRYEIILVKNFADDTIDAFCSSNGIKEIMMDGSIGEFYRKGIEESEGEIISFLDDDDIFTPDKLNEVIEAFRNNPELGLYYNRSIMCDRDQFNSKISGVLENNRSSIPDTVYTMKKDGLRFLMKNGWDGNNSSMSIKRDIVLNEIRNLVPIYENEDFFLYALTALSGFDILVGPKILTIRGRGNYNKTRIEGLSGTYFCERAADQLEHSIQTYSVLESMEERYRNVGNNEIFLVVESRLERLRMEEDIVNSRKTSLDKIFMIIKTGYRVFGVKYIIGTAYIYVVGLIHRIRLINRCQALKLIFTL